MRGVDRSVPDALIRCGACRGPFAHAQYMLDEEEQRVLKSLPYRDNSEFFDPKFLEVDRILAERDDRVAQV